MKQVAEDQLFRKGQMTRDPFDMTPEEEKDWQIQNQKDAQEYLFSIGQPLVYKKDGQMIAEYADGKVKVIG